MDALIICKYLFNNINFNLTSIAAWVRKFLLDCVSKIAFSREIFYHGIVFLAEF